MESVLILERHHAPTKHRYKPYQASHSEAPQDDDHPEVDSTPDHR